VGNDGKKISEPIDKYVPETIQDYCAHFAEKGEMQKVLQISQVMTKYFPKHSYGFDNIAGYYTTHGKWSEAKKYYEIAADLAPTDSLEWSNLGKVCEMLGDETGARKNYGKVISLNNNPEVVEIAKKALAELGRSKK
jgi:tetratricopeptide (TPR) repeat protein